MKRMFHYILYLHSMPLISPYFFILHTLKASFIDVNTGIRISVIGGCESKEMCDWILSTLYLMCRVKCCIRHLPL